MVLNFNKAFEIKNKAEHPKRDLYLKRWETCRDVIEGRDQMIIRGGYLREIKRSGLPENNDHLISEEYKKSAVLFNATGNTYTAFVGLLMKKAPKINLDITHPLFKDIDNSGSSLFEFTEECVSECVKVGMYGLMVDMDPHSKI